VTVSTLATKYIVQINSQSGVYANIVLVLQASLVYQSTLTRV